MTKPERYARVYLDSNTLSRYIARDEGWQTVDQIMDAADRKEITLLASTLILVECRGPTRDTGYDPAEEARLLSALDNPARMTPIEFSRRVALLARELAHEHRMSNYDAIHLASAIEGRADVLLTFDEGFPLRQEVRGVWVDKPYPPGGHDLFSGGF